MPSTDASHATSLGRRVPQVLSEAGFRGLDVVLPGGATAFVVRGGTGRPLVLQHGYAEDWRAWQAVMLDLVADHDVIVPTLPGMGGSPPWAGGSASLALGDWFAALVHAARIDEPIHLVAHDIGTWVACALAAEHPEQLAGLTLLDAVIPGITDPQLFALRPGSPLWHMHLLAHPEAPMALLAPHLDTFLPWLVQSKTVDKTVFDDRRLAHLVAFFQEPGVFDNANGYFRSVPVSIAETTKAIAASKFDKPVLVVSADHGRGQGMIDEVGAVWPQARGVVLPDAGHFLPEESPRQVAAVIRSLEL